MILEHQQLVSIRTYLEINGLNIPQVIDDLLDHLCCLVEEKMEKGVSFEEAFAEVKIIIDPNHIKEIQAYTIYFLTIKSKIMLVKGIFITAFLSVFFYVLGEMMYNILALVAENDPQLGHLMRFLLRTSGLFIFCFGFLPFLFRFGYKQFIAKLQG